MQAAIYCRVSSAGQEDNSSLETQEAACRKFASERGWEVAGVYREVHTGAELFERPQMTQLRTSVRKGSSSIVLAYALDRVSRNQAHLGFLLSEWDHLGVDLALVTEDLADTPEGRLLQSVRGFVAEVERMKIAERTQRGIRDRVTKGKPIPGQKAPYGYRWEDREKSAYATDDETAPIVRRIFDAVLGGHTLRSTAMALTAEGIRTPTGRSSRWEVSTLHCILGNPIYAGRPVAFRTRVERQKGRDRVVIRPEQEWVPLPREIVPALVTEAEFGAVQARLERNKAVAPRNNADPEATLLRCGFARCGYCGHPLSITKRRGRPHLYRCHSVGRERHGCPSFGISAPILDKAVWDRVEAILTEPAVIAAEVERRSGSNPFAADIEALDRRLAHIARQRSRLARAVATLEDDEAAAPLLAELQSLAAESKVLVAERIRLISQAAHHDVDRQRLADLVDWCERVGQNLPTLTYDQKRMVLEALGAVVKVYRGDHDPRWEITMAPIPVDEVGDDPLVFSTPTVSTTAIAPSIPSRSTA